MYVPLAVPLGTLIVMVWGPGVPAGKNVAKNGSSFPAGAALVLKAAGDPIAPPRFGYLV